MDIKIIRSKRKTLSLSVSKDGEVVVRAPLHLKEDKIYKFIEDKRGWIEKSLAKIMARNNFKDSFDFKNYIYLLGEKQSINNFNMAAGKISTKPSKTQMKDTFNVFYEKLYKEYAKKYLNKRVQEIAQTIGLNYKDLKICKSKRIWGSFNKDGTMKLNFKLIILPKPLIDYVIVHELCHGVQLNHSPKFWTLVGQALPNYKLLKKELENYGFLL